MEPILITLPQLATLGSCFAVLTTVFCLAAHRAGQTLGQSQGKAESARLHSNGLKRRIHDLEGELALQKVLVSSTKRRHEAEAANMAARLYELRAQLQDVRLTTVEAARLKKAAQLLDWAIGSHEGQHITPCIQTLLSLLKRQAPYEAQPKVLPAPALRPPSSSSSAALSAGGYAFNPSTGFASPSESRGAGTVKL